MEAEQSKVLNDQRIGSGPIDLPDEAFGLGQLMVINNCIKSDIDTGAVTMGKAAKPGYVVNGIGSCGASAISRAAYVDGISAMEKIVGKKRLTETLGDLIMKPAGKPVLVPESDKREAINTAEAAKADFTKED